MEKYGTLFDRAIFVQGELNDTMFAAVTPKIIALRKNSERPITVFIDSPGGALGIAEAVQNLPRIPDQAGRTCWINMVVTGRAWSAAAGLLAAGDYIIAYPCASIYFHGTRTSVDGITAEQAGNFQNELASMNKSMATNLATAAFNRLLLNYEGVKEQMPFLRKAMGKRLKTFEVLTGDGTIDVPAFVFYVFDKVREVRGSSRTGLYKN
ncbi:MAG: Clp protease [Deltaproteobacteria bacterium]|nr:Clp protease [Deltaproteobacteria bacterium]